MTANSFSIRPEMPDDAAGVRALLCSAFSGAGEADLVEALRREDDLVLSLVAEGREGLAGYLGFSTLQAPITALALAPLAVDPGHQKNGIGTALVHAGLTQAREDGWQAVFVLGDPLYYGRFGFRAEMARPFHCPYSGPHLMALALQGPLSHASGSIGYARAFADLA